MRFCRSVETDLPEDLLLDARGHGISLLWHSVYICNSKRMCTYRKILLLLNSVLDWYSENIYLISYVVRVTYLFVYINRLILIYVYEDLFVINFYLLSQIVFNIEDFNINDVHKIDKRMISTSGDNIFNVVGLQNRYQ